MSLREFQTKVLSRMLKLSKEDNLHSFPNHHPTSNGHNEVSTIGWKVLVYDSFCSDILSPVMNVSELKKLGITLHMNIKDKRERIPDVPAIYFVTPTQPNIDRILTDLNDNLYDSFHLHFTTSIPRPLLEHLASKSAEAGTSHRIAKVYDEYCNFICTEENFFTLNHANSYYTLASPTTKEDALLLFIDGIVDSLFSLMVTLNNVPIIRAQAGTAAELVASKLEERLRTHLQQRQNLFPPLMTSSLSYHRPLLILLDRSIDICAPLHHPWTYQALLNDLLGLTSNRLSIITDDVPTPAPNTSASKAPVAKSKPKQFDLSSNEDKFWRSNAGKPFPEVAKDVQEKLTKLTEEQKAITAKTSNSNMDDVTSATGDLQAAISALPALQKKKRLVEIHTNIASVLLRAIKARDIDYFNEIEINLINKSSTDYKSDIEKIINGKGTYKDRIRALIIYWLSTGANDEVINAFRATLTSQMNDINIQEPITPGLPSITTTGTNKSLLLAALDYIKQYKFMHRISTQSNSNSSSNSGSNNPSNIAAANTSGAGWRMFEQLATSVVSQTAGVIANVRNFLPTSNDLLIIKYVDNLIMNRDENENIPNSNIKFQYFDPRANKSRASKNNSGTKNNTLTYKDTIVFLLGGACYAEFANFQDFKVRQANTGLNTIIYGGTEINSPEQFLGQLQMLGEPLQSIGSNK